MKFLDLILFSPRFTHFNCSIRSFTWHEKKYQNYSKSYKNLLNFSISVHLSIPSSTHTLFHINLLGINTLDYIHTKVLYMLNIAQCICDFSERFTFPQVIQKREYLENVSSGGYFTCLTSVRSSGVDPLFSSHLSLLITWHEIKYGEKESSCIRDRTMSSVDCEIRTLRIAKIPEIHSWTVLTDA